MAFLRKNEFHPSLDINYDIISGMNRKESDDYRMWLIGERQKLHDAT
jgi:hypothetical protein